MIIELKRYVKSPTLSQLPALIQDPDYIQVEPLDMQADFSEVNVLTDKFFSDNPNPTSIERAGLDRELAIPLHKALIHLSPRDATDMCLWHWLCICQFQDLVWYRWYGRIPTDFSGIISSSLAERFLGAPTLRGISHNALARLWWCAQTLYDEKDGYDLVHTALKRQDLFVQIFERKFSLYVPAAKACMRCLKNTSEDESRQAAKELNHILTTIVIENFTEKEVASKLLSKFIKQSSKQ